MIAFLVTTPISIRMPITTGIEIGMWQIRSARIAPPMESGSENRMVSGWRKLPNSRISTPNTIIRPAPMARAKPSNTSPITSASPVWLIVTPGGRFLAVGRFITWLISSASASVPCMSPSMATRTARS